MTLMKSLALIPAGLFFAAACSQTPDAEKSAGSTTEPAGSEVPAAEAPSGPIIAETSDGVTVYGEPYFGDLGVDAPLILLFHQAGSNGRGEYAGLASWLNQNGYRAIAWDQRSGGDLYGEANRTSAGMSEGTPAEYCDAYPDLEAALDQVTAAGLAENVIVWGSSYSGSLVFRLGKDYPSVISGVIAFSPASGGPLVNCRARMWAADVAAPMFALRPASEMERAPSVEQREILTAAGVDFLVVENGVHGSSMLVDERTENDMSAARGAVLEWLESVTGKGNG